MMSLRSIFLALTLSTWAVARPTQPSKRWWTDPVDLGYAVVQGFKEDGLQKFYGIRYASAERFQAPHVPNTNRTLFTALDPPTECKQFAFGSLPAQYVNASAGSEDCLFLNVIAPEGTQAGDNLPVIFYIHGGGYHLGNAAGTDFSYGVKAAAAAGQPVVYVSIQYRLGPFGFLGGKEMYNGGVLNAGLLDQQFALQWAQRHIYYFGGDKSRVTIWGESAGAGSVMNQVLAHNGNTVAALGLDEPLFAGAILSSSFAPPLYTYDDPLSQAKYDNLVNATGCGDSSDTLQCLTQVDSVTLTQAGNQLGAEAPFGIWIYVPVIDGTIVPQTYSAALQSGQYNTHAIMSISNYNEGFGFTDPSLASADTNQTTEQLDAAFGSFLQTTYPTMTPDSIAQIIAEYPVSDFPMVNNTFNRAAVVNGLAIFVCPGVKIAQTSDGYYGNYVVGDATHGADLMTYFGNVTTQASSSLYESFVGTILSFAVNADPNQNPLNASINPQWSPINQDQVLVFNTTGLSPLGQADPSIQPANSPIAPAFTGRIDQCNFWQGSIAQYIPN